MVLKKIILLTLTLIISNWTLTTPVIFEGKDSNLSALNERTQSRLQPVACENMVAMNEDILNAVRKHRDSAFNTCLSCKGASCSFREFNESKTLAVCKRLFCTPIFISPGFETPADTPSGKSSFTYSYNISKEGSLENIEIISVEGVFNKKDAKKFIKARMRKTKFEPVVFKNKAYEIVNLTSNMVLNTRWEDRD